MVSGCPYVIYIHVSCLCQHTKNVIPKYSTNAVPQRWLFQGLKTVELPDYDQKEGYISEFCAPVDGPY